MKTRTGSKGNTIRLVVMVAIVTLLAISSVQGVAAEQSNDSITNDSLNMWAKCEEGGGSPEMETTITADGRFQTIVICNGGDYDGLVCGFTPTDSFCKFMWLVPQKDDDVVAPIDVVDVAPEPTKAPIVINEPVDLEPVVDPGKENSDSANETVEPTPTAEPTIDGSEIVDEVAPPTDEGEDAGGRDLPELQDDVVIDEVVEPGKGDDSGKGELPVINSPIDLSAPADAPIAGS